MKKIYISLLLQIFVAITAIANSYNTIPIDGNNSGWATDETFTNISSADNAYFTWDAEYIYIGISGSEADYNNMATFVYFDTDPLGTSGTTNAWAWLGSENFITTPFNSDWVVVWKNESGADFIEVMQYNNGSGNWEEFAASFSTSLQVASETVVEFAIGTDYREVKIKRSMLGNPDEFKTCMFTEQQFGSYWRYLGWPSDGWTDGSRGPGQSFSDYYGFFPEAGISPNRVPYFNAIFNLWTGVAKSTSWNDAGNWTNGVPTSNTLVKLPITATVIVDAAGAECDDILMKTGATLTVNTDGTLTSNGGIYNYTGTSGVIVQSSSSGNGSLIEYRYGNTMMTVQYYATASQWHSFAAPVYGLTSYELYLNANPEVWLAEYDEPTRDYTFITAFTEPIDDIKGWMLWVGGTGSHTYDFTGLARESVQGEDDNATRSTVGDGFGFAYVGNPFSSAIDWDASLGWTKTNLNNAIYIKNGSGWATYVGGVGTPIGVGSQYIAMNQGFFVQVTDNNAPPEYGTLKMSRDVCVHNSVGYLKTTTVDSLIRLQLNQSENSDETVVRFVTDATEGFDGQYDAGKMFSYSDNQPLIFSISDSSTFSISSLPHSIQVIPIDVMGIDGISMTISANEIVSFTNVYLKDKITGIVTNIAIEDYSFIYDNSFADRFEMFFTITDVDELAENNLSLIAHSSNNIITVQVNNANSYNIFVTNLLGQQVFNKQTNQSILNIPINESGLYIISVQSGNSVRTKKIFVK